MKIQDLTEAKFSKPIRAYHSTNKNNLRSILKIGLMSKDGGGFGSDIKGSEQVRDMKPVSKAVYLTNSITFASYIGKKVSSGEGTYVLVEVLVQTRSAAIDEDYFETKLNSLLQPRGSSDTVMTLLRFLYEDEFSNKVLNHVIDKWPTFSRVDVKKLLNLCEANLWRTVSHIPKKSLETYLLKNITFISKGDEEKENRIITDFYNKLPDSQTAEQNYKNVLAWATKILKHSIKDIDTSYDFSDTHSFRIDSNITYNGKNKIVGVFLVSEDEKIIETYYGHPQSLLASEIFQGYEVVDK